MKSFISPQCLLGKKERGARQERTIFFFGASQSGSALIGVIVVMTVIASIGAAAFKLTSSSQMTQLGSVDSTKAYYLAESGYRHAKKEINSFEGGKSSYSTRTDLINALHNKVFSLTPNGQFKTALSYSGNIYTVVSTGMPNSGSSRKVTYEIYIPPGGKDGKPLPFDEDPTDKKALNPDNWNVSGDKTKVKKNGTQLELDPTKKNPESQVSLDWHNPKSSLPNLLEVWQRSNQLLSYEFQVKMVSAKNKDIVTGLSFRLGTGANKASAADDSFYGFSHLYSEKDLDLPDYKDRNGNTLSFGSKKAYVVLWKQQAGVRTILQMIPAPFDEWLFSVKVVERYGSTGARENLIYCYIQEKSKYAVGTIHWDYSQLIPVKWTGCQAQHDCSTAKDCSCIVDTSLVTTDTFGTGDPTKYPDELGLHAFGDNSGKVAFSDLAIRFNEGNDSTTQY